MIDVLPPLLPKDWIPSEVKNGDNHDAIAVEVVEHSIRESSERCSPHIPVPSTVLPWVLLEQS